MGQAPSAAGSELIGCSSRYQEDDVNSNNKTSKFIIIYLKFTPNLTLFIGFSAHQEALLAEDKEVLKKRMAARELLNSLRVDAEAEDDGQEVFNRQVDADAHEAALASMNDGQRKQYEEICEHVAKQVKL